MDLTCHGVLANMVVLCSFVKVGRLFLVSELILAL